MKQKLLKEILKDLVKEEYKGFRKDRNFKLNPDPETKPDPDDEESQSGFDKVSYLPKFDRIRRDLRKFSGEVKGYKTSPDPNISDLAKDITKTLNQLGQLIHILDNNLKQKGIN